MTKKKSNSRTWADIRGNPSKKESAQFADAIKKCGEKMLSVYAAWEAEAEALFHAVGDDKSIPKMESYLRSNPPSAGAIALVLDIARKKLQSQNASTRASATRKKDEKTTALELWKAWQAHPNTYQNKQQFNADVMLKCEVSQNTARHWFDEFRASPSPEWEAIYGKKYTNL